MNIFDARPLKIILSWIIIIALTYLVTNSVNSNVNNVPKITVTASAEVQATPDEARITASLENENANQNTANKENSAKATEVVNQIIAAGIAKKDIETSVSVYPKTKYDRGKVTEEGYIASTSFVINLKDTSKAESVISILTKNEAKSVAGPNFDLSKAEVVAHQAEAQAEALADAKSQAEAMATANGQRIGRILSLTPSAASSNDYYPLSKSLGIAAADIGETASADSSRINPGEQTINASITVTFELK